MDLFSGVGEKFYFFKKESCSSDFEKVTYKDVNTCFTTS